jgi:uncharacterized membrane-anchored protein
MGTLFYVLAMVVSFALGWATGNYSFTLIGVALMVNGALTLAWEDMRGDARHER